MQKERKQFMPLTPDLDERLDRLAEEKGVPKLVRANEGEVGKASDKAPSTPEKAALRAPSVRLNLEIPDYLSLELKIKAATEKSTARHIVLSALRQAGYRIDDADMAPDGRREG